MRVTYNRAEWVVSSSLGYCDYFQRWLRRNYPNHYVCFRGGNAMRHLRELGVVGQNVPATTLISGSIFVKAVHEYNSTDPKYPIEIPKEWKHICIDDKHFFVTPFKILNGSPSWLQLSGGSGIINVYGAHLLETIYAASNCTFVKIEPFDEQVIVEMGHEQVRVQVVVALNF